VSQTDQTWLIAAATVGAAIVGGFLGVLGAARLQSRKAKQEARHRLENGAAELLAAAVDVLAGARALRVAHGRRTRSMYYLRVAGDLLTALPEMTSVQVLKEWETMRSVLSSLMRLERVGLDDDRMIALDTATVLSPKLTRYFAAIAQFTLGEDKVIADGVRKANAEGHRDRGRGRGPEAEIQAARMRSAESGGGVPYPRRQAPWQREVGDQTRQLKARHDIVACNG
jgi:hypothetical protein